MAFKDYAWTLRTCSRTIINGSLSFFWFSVIMTHCKYYFEILFYVTFVFIKEKFSNDNNKFFWKKFVIVISFFSFKGITHAHLLKISITHHRYLIPLLNLLINYTSARSAHQTLSIKVECIFLSWNFLIIGLSIFFLLTAGLTCSHF